MKFSAAAVLAAAAGVYAGHASNVTYTTEVVDVYTTYCPGPTQITHGDKTYTITEATTFTITDCPCTITKPVITTSAVVCNDCSPAPGYTNSTWVVVPTQPAQPEQPQPTGSSPAPSGSGVGPKPTTVPVAAAGKVALSGAGLAGIVGLAAFFL